MIDKLNTDMLPGVRKYWIIDQKQENIMIYGFADCEIDTYRTFEKGAVAKSVVFDGLSADVESLFEELL